MSFVCNRLRIIFGVLVRNAGCPVRLTCQVLVACVFGLMLSGCSMVRLAYENADWLLLRKIDSYLDLDQVQRELASGLLEKRLRNHRARELPVWIAFLRRAGDHAADGLTERELSALTTETIDLFRHLVATRFRLR